MRSSGSTLVQHLRHVLLLGGLGALTVSVQAQAQPPKLPSTPASAEDYNRDVLPTGGIPGETATISSLDMAWMEATQMNLMRPGLGTTVQSGPKQMVSEDPTMETTLPPGLTSPVIRFKDAQVVNTFIFFNFLGSGNVTVSGALTDAGAPAWKVLADKAPFSGPGPVTVRLSPTEVRLIRLDFNCPQGGSIASVSLYGDMRMADFVTQINSTPNSAMPQSRINPNDEIDQTRESINVAYNQWGARIIYVSSGDTTPETLRFQNDYNPATVFQFAPSDPKPTEILRLPQVIPIKRVAMLLEAPVGRIDIYLLRDLPEDISKLTYDANGKPQGEKVPEAQARASFDKLFKERSPKATTFTKKGPNRLELGFLPADCRYMLITFSPGVTSGGANTPTLTSLPVHQAILASPLANLMWSPFTQTDGTGLTVSEIAAFGFLTKDDLFVVPENDLPGSNPPAANAGNPPILPPNSVDDLPDPPGSVTP